MLFIHHFPHSFYFVNRGKKIPKTNKHQPEPQNHAFKRNLFVGIYPGLGYNECKEAPLISILIIGNEILSAQVEDVNLKYMLGKLNKAGYVIDEVRIVRDDVPVIAGALKELSAHSQFVISTGGVGPTHDDVTFQAYAAAFDMPLEMHAELEQRIRGFFGEETTSASLRMAVVPRGTELIISGPSSWPIVKVANCFVLPGLPEVFFKKFDGVLAWLPQPPDRYFAQLRTQSPEVDFAAELTTLQEAHPQVEIGSYPTYDHTHHAASLTFKSGDLSVLNAVFNHMRAFFLERDSLVDVDEPVCIAQKEQ